MVKVMRRIIIAIDGYSSCGKSTMARSLARKIGYTYIDTGAMYRAAALFALRGGYVSVDGMKIKEEAFKEEMPQLSISFRQDVATSTSATMLGTECVESEIRSPQVASIVSRVAALPFVREKLTQIQRRMGEGGGIVMDGRDIGTTVFPQAELKIFVTADDEVRARRRFDELCSRGVSVTYEETLRSVRERDYIDTHRGVSPLRKAEDAIVLDNSHLTIPEQDALLMKYYEEAASR